MYKDNIPQRFQFVLNKVDQAIDDCEHVADPQEFLLSPGGMILFDATVMRIQVIGEMLKQIDDATNGEILCNYPEIPWRSVFGMRNFISHEYCMIDPDKIFYTIKDDLPPLAEVLKRIITDLSNATAAYTRH